jgi:formate hydrogenlyase transcriptional activator
MTRPTGDACSQNGCQEIVGESPALQTVLKLAMKAASSDASVLILGEAGSGKELLARAIHRISLRRNESFVKVNCSTADEGALESDLFGDADATIGHLETANKGILFLHEVAHTPLCLQAKLLRVLENHEFQPPGSAHSIDVNVKLIAATKYDLGEQVAEETFCEDLYDRLNVFSILIPPLRERRGDIPLLVRYFVQKFGRRRNKCIESIPADTMNFLTNADWPDNVRQLENLIEQSVALTLGSTLRLPIAG